MIKIAWDESCHHPLPVGHRFPMEKYTLIPEQLLYEGTIQEDQIIRPQQMAEETILLTHSADYLEKLKFLSLSKHEERKTGFPLSDTLVNRERIICQGTLDCALYALENSTCALNIAGGTHHAFADSGEGFCLLNDMAITANYLLTNKFVSKVLIIDLDVHQGNGTASIFENRTDVFTFSMHGANNFPLHKEKSHWDIELADGTKDEEYLRILNESLTILFESVQADLVMYLCGVDVLFSDKLGRLSLSMDACARRDEMVFQYCKKNGLPIVCAMGGGYSERLSDIVQAHVNTFRLADFYFGN